jgi:hypothetical protein
VNHRLDRLSQISKAKKKKKHSSADPDLIRVHSVYEFSLPKRQTIVSPFVPIDSVKIKNKKATSEGVHRWEFTCRSDLGCESNVATILQIAEESLASIC